MGGRIGVNYGFKVSEITDALRSFRNDDAYALRNGIATRRKLYRRNARKTPSRRLSDSADESEDDLAKVKREAQR
jgi:hypothetical protein